MSSQSENDVEHHQSPLSNSNARQLRNRIVKSAKKNENDLKEKNHQISARKSVAVHRQIDKDDQPDENLLNSVVKTPKSRKTMPSSSYKKIDTDKKPINKIKSAELIAVTTTPSKKNLDLPKTPKSPKSTRKRQTIGSAIKKTPNKNIEKKSDFSNNENQTNNIDDNSSAESITDQQTNIAEEKIEEVAKEMPIVEKKIYKKSKKTKIQIDSSNSKNESTKEQMDPAMVVVDDNKTNDKKIYKKTKKSKIETDSSSSKNEENQKNVDNNSFTISNEIISKQEPANLPTNEKSNESQTMIVVDNNKTDENQQNIIDNNSFTISAESTKEQESANLSANEQNKESQELTVIVDDKIKSDDKPINKESGKANKKTKIESNSSNNFDHKNNIDNTSFTISTDSTSTNPHIILSAIENNKEPQLESVLDVVDNVTMEDSTTHQDQQNNINDISFIISSEPTDEQHNIKSEIIGMEVDNEMQTDVIDQSEETTITNKTHEISKNNSNNIETPQIASLNSEDSIKLTNDKKTIDSIEEIPENIDENNETPLFLDAGDDEGDNNEHQKTISLDIEIFPINTSLTPLGRNNSTETAQSLPTSEKQSIIDLSDQTFNESGIILIPDTPPIIKTESRCLNETFSPVPSLPNQAIQVKHSPTALSSSSSGLNTTFSPEKPTNVVTATKSLAPPSPKEVKLSVSSTNTSTPRSPHIKRSVSIKSSTGKSSATKTKSIKALSICRREQTPFKQKSAILSSVGPIKTKIDLINSTLGLTSNLKTIRKRSISVDGGPIMVSAKKNIRVTFHSPSNNEISIQQIDQIMEESRREFGGGAIGGGFGSLRRKRSLSNNDIVHIKDDNDKVKKPTKSNRLPDFALIHQKNFDRMESISEYAKRKDERSKILRSGQKSQTKREEVKNQKPKTFNTSEAKKSLFNVATAISDSSTNASSSLTNNITTTTTTTIYEQQSTVTASSSVVSNLPTQTSTTTTSTRPKSATTVAPVLNKTPSKIKTNTIVTNFAASFNAPSQMMATASSSSLVPMIKPKVAANHRELFKGKTKKADVTGENKKILKGVRTNRRFDLQMKFRHDSEDNN